ncbi:MAG: ribosome-associated translation inhibitor RaiA [Andreesenia angusta]|nr:ribosome-associated translation inhibitor RaiA [Andreesenia angusta]
MIYTLVGRNVEVTDALDDAVDRKLSKLDKYFHDDVEASVTLSVQKNSQTVEVTIPLKRGSIVRVEESTEDMYASLDKAIDVLERQIRRHKEKIKDKKSMDTIRFENIESLPREEEEEDSKIVKVKRFPIKPMNEEEAILQMELIGHAFFVFENAETGDANVVYKRKDGDYGLIEPQY